MHIAIPLSIRLTAKPNQYVALVGLEPVVSSGFSLYSRGFVSPGQGDAAATGMLQCSFIPIRVN